MNVIDSHLHLFKAYSKHYPRPVHPGLADEDREVLAQELIVEMEKAGVDKAIVVPLGPEDHYISELRKEYPGKFATVGIYDEDAPNQADNLDQRIEESNIQGIRVGYVDQQASPDDNPEKYAMFPLFKAMAERGLKVWFYAEPPQVELFERVLKLFPELVAVFNHCGFMVSLDNLSIDKNARPHFNVSIPPPTLDLLEKISLNKNTYVHFSGQYAFSHDPYPYPDMLSVSQRLLKIFGYERLLWASDFPWTMVIPGYAEQLNLVGKLLPDISQGEQELIQGGNAERLFRF
ncbi:MAG: hypothetical protein MAG581_02452 [Deltaproteobacteria bacterium]|jgi:predicted TIM-barrel fold metal-dependent hydrolase|nr:hypothetical protein [Deltaproteobacteria bacterium]